MSVVPPPAWDELYGRAVVSPIGIAEAELLHGGMPAVPMDPKRNDSVRRATDKQVDFLRALVHNYSLWPEIDFDATVLDALDRNALDIELARDLIALYVAKRDGKKLFGGTQ